MPHPAHTRPFLSARWHALAMLNYEVDPDLLAPLVPADTLLDSFAGKTYVSLVGFLFLRTRVLGLPIPGHRHFEEVNLRFYVRREVGDEVRRGVCFIKELVPRRAIAVTARLAYNEPYHALPMAHALSGPIRQSVEAAAGMKLRRAGDAGALDAGIATYRWRFGGRWTEMSLTHSGQPAPLVAGSEEEFITEHYWGYCRQRDGGTVEYRVEHPRWNVWRGESARVAGDPAALYGARFGAVLSKSPASALLADGSAVTVFQPCRIPLERSAIGGRQFR